MKPSPPANPLLPLALCFLAGILLARWGGGPPASLPPFPFLRNASATAALGLSLVSPTPLALAASGFSGGVLAFLPPFPRGKGEPGRRWGTFTGTVEGVSGSAGREQLLLRASGQEGGGDVRFSVRLSGEGGHLPVAGQRIRFRAGLSPAPGGWRGTLEEGGWTPLPTVDVFARAKERVRSAAPGADSGVWRALALGETEGVGPAAARVFTVTGTMHLLAVSGVHVGVALALALLALRPAAIPLAAGKAPLFPLAATLLGGGALVPYLGMVRDSASAFRAAVFGALLLTASPLRREGSLLQGVAIALLGLSCLLTGPQPDLSLLLSLAGCLGIASAWRAGEGWGVRLGRISVGAGVMTLPLVAFSFRALPLLGVPFNLVFSPLFDLLLIPLSIAGDASALLCPALLPHLFTFWDLLAHPTLGALALCARFPSLLPLGPPGAVAAALSGTAGALAWWRSRGDLRVGAAVLLLAPLAGWGADAAARAAAGEALRVTFAGVGQSDMILIRCRGQTALLDAGPPPSGTVPRSARFLAAEGVDRVDLLVLTHPHPDHVGGAAFLLAGGRARTLVLPASARAAAGDWGPVLASVPPGVGVVTAGRGTRLKLGEGELLILDGGEGAADPGGNGGSLIALLRWRDRRLLFGGDAPWGPFLKAWEEAGPVDLLKVPHHGSAGSGFPGRFPAGLGALLAVFTARGDEDAPLPSPRVREAFFRARIPTRTTGREGFALAGDGVGRLFPVDNRHALLLTNKRYSLGFSATCFRVALPALMGRPFQGSDGPLCPGRRRRSILPPAVQGSPRGGGVLPRGGFLLR